MNYWRRQGYEDALNGRPARSLKFFLAAQLSKRTYEHYMSGYRSGLEYNPCET